MNKIDLTNQRFEKLLVIKEATNDTRVYDVFWQCKCDCGKTVNIGGNSLRRGMTTSCGCAPKKKKLNKTIIDGDTIKIFLNHNKVCFIDKDDYDKVKNFTWHEHKGYAYTYNEQTQKYVAMHQIITGKNNIDHIDRNGLNNKKENLREATMQTNAWNKDKRKDNTSGYKGVYRSTSAWIASIQGKYLGSYKTKEEAAEAYDMAALKLFGEFAKLNFEEKREEYMSKIHSH